MNSPCFYRIVLRPIALKAGATHFALSFWRCFEAFIRIQNTSKQESHPKTSVGLKLPRGRRSLLLHLASPLAAFRSRASGSKGICQSHGNDERELVWLFRACSGEWDGSPGDSRMESFRWSNPSAGMWNLEHGKLLVLVPVPPSCAFIPHFLPGLFASFLTHLFCTFVTADTTLCLFGVETISNINSESQHHQTVTAAFWFSHAGYWWISDVFNSPKSEVSRGLAESLLAFSTCNSLFFCHFWALGSPPFPCTVDLQTGHK